VLCSEFLPEDLSPEDDGDRGRLQVSDVWGTATGLRDLGRHPPPLGPAGGDLLEIGDRARNGPRLSNGDRDLRLLRL
jgi:hypothetical protein